MHITFERVTEWLWTPQPDIVDIDMGEYRRGRGKLRAYGASPCILMVAHNAAKGEGLVGDFSELAAANDSARVPADQEVFNNAVAEVPSLGPIEATEIWLGGGGIHFSDGSFPEVADDRAFAQTAAGSLIQAGLLETALHIDWLEEDASVSVLLDAQTGALLVQQTPL